ncbi:MAG: CHAT domain-containing protein [Microcoleaceae cyanobacterium]
MTQEFDISVTPVGDGEYLVRTEKVASGVPLAEEQVRWPIQEWLSATRELMNDPLMGVLEGKRSLSHRHSSTSTQNLSLVELGQQLYQGLFQGTLRESWTCAQAIAQNRSELLQLRLGVKSRELSSLPWEVLHAGDRPVATGTEVVFSRYQPNTSAVVHIHPLQANQPLKILMAIAAPNDQDSLQLKREVNHLKEELQRDTQRMMVNSYERTRHTPEIQLTLLEQPDREQLTQALEQGQYQVFHYAGHSNLATAGGELYLVNRKTGLTEILGGEDLAGLLVNNGVQVAVLNSCRGAYRHAVKSNSETSEINLTEMLVKRGIPGVLAMAERIPDEVALTLTRLLYRNLNQGYPVDLSLSRARQGLISAYGSRQLYWALPVLYLHREFDARLTGTQPCLPESQLLLSNALFPGKSVTLDNREESEFLAAFNSFEEEEPLFPDDVLNDIGYLADEPVTQEAGNTEFIGDILNQIKQNSVKQSPVEPATSDRIGTFEDLLPLIQRNFAAQIPPLPESLSKLKPLWEKVKSKARKPPIKCLLISSLVLLPFGIWHSTQGQSAPATSVYASLTQTKKFAVDLESVVTEQVADIALEQFRQGNIEAGIEATIELLNRGAWMEARTALKAVPLRDRNQPEINFLRGRFMWQSIEYGNTEYKISQVRNNWEKAAQQRPEFLEYQNALGFAYYLEGDIKKAYQTWSTIAFNQFNPLQAEPANPSEQEALNTYAGLGLVLMKSAQNLSAEEQISRLSKAIKLREKVMTEGADLFRPRTLAQNWLWSNQLVRDWQMLLKTEDRQG